MPTDPPRQADLIPAVAQQARLVGWVRRRARAGGLRGLHGVHLVSAVTREGVPALAEQLEVKGTASFSPRGALCFTPLTPHERSHRLSLCLPPDGAFLATPLGGRAINDEVR